MPTMRRSTAQKSLVQNQQLEIVRINKLYDAELERLRALWNGARPGSLGPVRGRLGAGAAQGSRTRAGLAQPLPPSFFFSSSLTCARVALALGGLHRLADQRIEGLLLAGAEFLDRSSGWPPAPRR